MAVLLGGATTAAAQGVPTAPATREQATATIEQARQDSAEIERRYQLARGECEMRFFVNPCLEDARRERDRAMRQVRDREVAARETLRTIDAADRARARAERPSAKSTQKDAAPIAAPAAQEGAAAASPPPRSPQTTPAAGPGQAEEAAVRRRMEAEQRQAKAKQRAAEHERRSSEQAEKAAQGPAKVEEYELRQREAQARAQEKARVAEENRQRRERRAQERSAAKDQPASAGGK